MVETYLKDLLTKAHYDDDVIGTIIQEILYKPHLHEQRFLIADLQEMGVRAKYHGELPDISDAWPRMRLWLKAHYMRPSPIHFIRYVLPRVEGGDDGDAKPQQEDTHKR